MILRRVCSSTKSCSTKQQRDPGRGWAFREDSVGREGCVSDRRPREVSRRARQEENHLESVPEETIQEKSTVDYRLVSYTAAVTQYEPEIKQLEEKLYQTKDESEKKSLNQKLEDLKKEFEAKRKKYTLTEEKFGENEKLESASYKLLFFNPRGPAEKRLMRVDLDQFYRPVKVGFEEE